MGSYEELRKEFRKRNPKADMDERFSASGLSNFDDEYKKRPAYMRTWSRQRFRRWQVKQRKKSPLTSAAEELANKYRKNA